jgi:dTMP kinase
MQKNTIKDAWMKMAKGMFIHEYILDIEPLFFEPRRKRLYNLYRSNNNDGKEKTINDFKNIFSYGFLEHCFEERNKDLFLQVYTKLVKNIIYMKFEEKKVLILKQDYCFKENQSNIIDISKLLIPNDYYNYQINEIYNLINKVDLLFLVNFLLDVIIIKDESNFKMNYSIDNTNTLFGTCEINRNDHFFIQTENILSQLSAQWIYASIMARPDLTFPEYKEWKSPWSDNYIETIEFIIEIFSHCIRLHFYETLFRLNLITKEEFKKIFLFEYGKLEKVQDFVYSINSILNNKIIINQKSHNNSLVDNILWTFYPGYRRFEKYRMGLGIGQSGSEKAIEEKRNLSSSLLKKNEYSIQFENILKKKIKQDKKHYFIIFEGGDASGKTTFRKYLFKKLKNMGIDSLCTISFSWLCPDCTRIITNARFSNYKYSKSDILSSYKHDKELLSEKIIRSQLKNYHIISDRYIISDIVYNKVMFDIDINKTYEAYNNSSILIPDLIVYFDVKPNIAFERNIKRLTNQNTEKHPWDDFEKQKHIYKLFHDVLIEKILHFNSTVIIINNNGNLEDTIEEFNRKVISYFDS